MVVDHGQGLVVEWRHVDVGVLVDDALTGFVDSFTPLGAILANWVAQRALVVHNAHASVVVGLSARLNLLRLNLLLQFLQSPQALCSLHQGALSLILMVGEVFVIAPGHGRAARNALNVLFFIGSDHYFVLYFAWFTGMLDGGLLCAECPFLSRDLSAVDVRRWLVMALHLLLVLPHCHVLWLRLLDISVAGSTLSGSLA